MKKLIALTLFGLFHAIVPAQTCTLVPNSKKCVDTTPCKPVGDGQACLANAVAPSGAAKLSETCWQYSYDFACTGSTVNTCTPYENNSACAIVSSQCVDYIPETGKCSEYQNVYTCKTKNEVTEQKLNCTSGVFSDSMFPKPNNPNGNFIKAALAQEIIREGATYGKDGENLFAGVRESCTKGYGGIKNCCKSAPGAQSNSAMASVVMSAGFSVVKYAGAKAVDLASPYVFDAMFQGSQFTAGLAWDFAASNSNVVVDMLGNAPVGTNFAASGMSLSAYGFTFQSGIAAQGSGFLGANSTLATFGSGSSTYSITFNPYVFAALVAIQVLQELASCDDAERLLALHKGANLSVYLYTECSQKVLGVCLEWRQTYCSFNSVLAKIINTQGKPQIGKSVADCKGLSVSEMTRIDFSRIDFSEFSGAMVQQAVQHTPTNIKGNYTSVMQNKPSGTAQGTNLVIPTYNK